MIRLGALFPLLLAAAGCSPTTLTRPTVTLASPAVVSPARPVAVELVRALEGGIIPATAASQLSAFDRNRALESEYRALEYGAAGEVVRWEGRERGTSGEVVPAQPYRVGSQDCRQYRHTLVVSGRQQVFRGSACRNADGSWTPL